MNCTVRWCLSLRQYFIKYVSELFSMCVTRPVALSMRWRFTIFDIFSFILLFCTKGSISKPYAPLMSDMFMRS